jgi:hypothetical protein
MIKLIEYPEQSTLMISGGATLSVVGSNVPTLSIYEVYLVIYLINMINEIVFPSNSFKSNIIDITGKDFSLRHSL